MQSRRGRWTKGTYMQMVAFMTDAEFGGFKAYPVPPDDDLQGPILATLVAC